jgi:hypothetical protein
MLEFIKNLTQTQKVVGLVVVLVVAYLLFTQYENLYYWQYENLEGKPIQSSQAVIVNKPDNKLGAQEYKQPEVAPGITLYDRHTGSVVSGSEFVGLPNEIEPANGDATVPNYGAVDRLDDGYNGAGGLNYNVCSKSCCGPQYPPPFGLEEDEYVAKHKGDFVPNDYMCNNAWNNSGCVCMTKDQREYISSRGHNAITKQYDQCDN